MTRPTVTIDTNCINARSSLPAMNQLERLHRDGQLELVKSDVLDTELQRSRYESVAQAKSAALGEDTGTLVIGHSRIGHARVGTDGDAVLYDDIATTLFGHPVRRLHKRQVRDVMMIATHMKHRRDSLVTLDNDLLGKRTELQENFGVRVLSPDQCLAQVPGWSE